MFFKIDIFLFKDHRDISTTLCVLWSFITILIFLSHRPNSHPCFFFFFFLPCGYPANTNTHTLRVRSCYFSWLATGHVWTSRWFTVLFLLRFISFLLSRVLWDIFTLPVSYGRTESVVFTLHMTGVWKCEGEKNAILRFFRFFWKGQIWSWEAEWYFWSVQVTILILCVKYCDF